MKIFISLLFCILPIFNSCHHENSPLIPSEDIANKSCGEYELSEVFWSGEALDLNKDHISYWNLLQNEFAHLWGYHTPNHTAYVAIASSKTFHQHPALDFTLQIPYPFFEIQDSLYITTHIKYCPLVIRGFYLDNNYLESKHIFKIKETDTSDPFLNNIKEIFITQITANQFILRLHCTMYHPAQESNYLYYIYKKIKPSPQIIPYRYN